MLLFSKATTFNGDPAITSWELAYSQQKIELNPGRMSHSRLDAVADVAAEFGTLDSEPAPAAGEVVLGLVLLSACFLAPSMPPIMAAATTSARQIAKRIQKSRRRNPHILRGFGGGGLLR